MERADKAEVTWGDGDHKKGWTIRVQVGAEVIRRRPEKAPGHDADEAAIRALAVTTAADEGYALDPASVAIRR